MCPQQRFRAKTVSIVGGPPGDAKKLSAVYRDKMRFRAEDMYEGIDRIHRKIAEASVLPDT